MEYRIIEKPGFTVVGKTLRVSTKDGENLNSIPQFWNRSHQDGTLETLTGLALDGAPPGGVTLGICTDFSDNMEKFTYMIAAQVPADIASFGGVPQGMIEQSIPAATWAVFQAKGSLPDSIQTVWSRIWSEFFADEQYVHGFGPDLELYPPGNPMASDYGCEVWIPVVRK